MLATLPTESQAIAIQNARLHALTAVPRPKNEKSPAIQGRGFFIFGSLEPLQIVAIQ